MNLKDLSKIAYEAVRAYDQSVMNDYSQKPYDGLSDATKQAFEQRVTYLLEHRRAPVSCLHDKWMVDLLQAGWTYGQVTDKEKKTHAKLLPFSLLPEKEQLRDLLFARIVEALA
jgi:hypothetical protein